MARYGLCLDPSDRSGNLQVPSDIGQLEERIRRYSQPNLLTVPEAVPALRAVGKPSRGNPDQVRAGIDLDLIAVELPSCRGASRHGDVCHPRSPRGDDDWTGDHVDLDAW